MVKNPKIIFLTLINYYIKGIFKNKNIIKLYDCFNNDLMNIISYAKCIYNIELFKN